MRRRSLFKTVWILLAVLLIFAGGIRVMALASSVEQPTERNYISVQIHAGDTLWSVAEEYCGSSLNQDIRDYVDEIREINHIVNERSLKPGAYLMVYTVGE